MNKNFLKWGLKRYVAIMCVVATVIMIMYIIINETAKTIADRNNKISSMDKTKNEFLKTLSGQLVPKRSRLNDLIKEQESLSKDIDSLTQCYEGVKDSLGTLGFFDCNKHGLLPSANASMGTVSGRPEESTALRY